MKMLSWARLSELGGWVDWEERLHAPAKTREAERLRRATFSGTPFGEPDFVTELERRFGRTLPPRTAGRPRKAKATAAVVG